MVMVLVAELTALLASPPYDAFSVADPAVDPVNCTVHTPVEVE